jgi:hypothetical protein
LVGTTKRIKQLFRFRRRGKKQISKQQHQRNSNDDNNNNFSLRRQNQVVETNESCFRVVPLTQSALRFRYQYDSDRNIKEASYKSVNESQHLKMADEYSLKGSFLTKNSTHDDVLHVPSFSMDGVDDTSNPRNEVLHIYGKNNYSLSKESSLFSSLSSCNSELSEREEALRYLERALDGIVPYDERSFKQ